MVYDKDTNYEIINELGYGAFGTVYFAKNRQTRQGVAIKIISNSSQPQLIVNETNTLQLNISDSFYTIDYKEAFIHEHEVWIVMEYCKYGSVADYIRKGNQFSEEQIRDILACTLLGLMHLHSHNIIHRDIKPDNLLFSQLGVIKLCDFGLATKLSETATHDTCICGTYNYMAPEIFENRTTKKSDIWALGITAYEIAEGVNPYQGSIPAMIYSICYNVPPTLSKDKWSASFVDFVSLCLQRDEYSRPSVAKLMGHPFVKEAIIRICEDSNSGIIALMLLNNSSQPIPMSDSSITIPDPPNIPSNPPSFISSKTLEGSDSSITIPDPPIIPSNPPSFISSKTLKGSDSSNTSLTSGTLTPSTYAMIRCFNDYNNLSMDITQLVVADNVCNDINISIFKLDLFLKLESISIGNNCFMNCINFCLESLPSLKTVFIGTHSFVLTSIEQIEKEKIMKRGVTCRIANCSSLISIQFGIYSFAEAISLDLAKLPALEKLVFGIIDKLSACFYYTNCTIEDLPSVKSIIFGKWTFSDSLHTRIANLSALESIKIGNSALNGNNETHNSLQLIYLPKLRRIEAISYAFYYVEEVYITDVPSLTYINLPHGFFSLKIDNTDSEIVKHYFNLVKQRNMSIRNSISHYSVYSNKV